ncbi:MAG: chemotaxis response regulator protein-glutamate methylesterase [Steroidobacteraceae bacterium]|nr:chemotaxis response regulator protein-glutamate methylesterase [Deltaproteobacteria bacterium]
MKPETIKVLIVDDSAGMRMMLEQIFGADPAFEVAGLASDGIEAVEAVERLAPDVITMDIQMPRMDGLEATRRIMETRPTPIVILSGNLDQQEVASSFRAMEAGALVALPKPRGVAHPEYEADVANLVRKVKLMAEVKLVRRWPRMDKGTLPPPPVRLEVSKQSPAADLKAVAIGASTGGPVVINTILSGLPSSFPLPILIVQHMASGFIRGFADWLNRSSRLPVQVASHGELLLPGHVYIATEGFNLEVTAGGRIALTGTVLEHGQCPSVSALFRSMAEIYGRNAVGILLTGMGDDGARELKLMKDKGAVTIAQDRESSVIFGMPGEAVKFGAATYVLPPDRIVELLLSKYTRSITKGTGR